MADTEPSAPTQTDPGAGAAPAAPVDPGTTNPEPKPADAGTGDGTTPPAPAAGDDGKTPPAPDKPADGTDPKPADGEGDGAKDGKDDKPADDPAKVTTPGEGSDDLPDPKKMTRAERVQYYQNLESNTRKSVEATVNATYQPQTVDELKQKYIDEGHDEFQATMLAREEVRDQEADISKARAERAELNANLAVEATEVLNTFGWLNPKDAANYDKDSSDAAVDLYDQLCLTRDENTAQTGDDGKPIPGTGQIIGATMTPKAFYGLLDKIRSSGSETARVAAQKAAEEQLAAVAPPSSNNKQVDKSFDQLSNDEKRERLRAQGHFVT